MNKKMQKVAAIVMAFTLFHQTNIFAKAASIKKSYNVKITASRLNVRNKPSLSGKIVAKYTKGNIVSVTGQVGKYLKTNKGYIHYAYTQNYLSGAKVEVNTASKKGDGRYIVVNNDAQLIININTNVVNERYAVKNKKYKLIEETDKYYKIKIGKVSGYISKDNASILSTLIKDNINIGWDYVYSKANNKYLYDNPSDPVMRSSASIGLDVLSPTWFDMTGDPKKPVLVDKADKQYMTVAHKNGYEVWPRFCEMNPDRAYVIFNNSVIREQVINSVVSKAIEYDVDGINIDFEGIGSRNKDGLTAFTKELSAKLSALSISTSIDVTRPDGSDTWSLCYDRPKLAKYVDYMALMAYDEHTASSPGPTGSYTWVEDSIKKTIAQGVPGEKILLGIPFYMRDYTIPDLKVPTGSVIFQNLGKIYKTPNESDYNVLKTATANEYFKYILTYEDFYVVQMPLGDIGYISKMDAVYKSQSPTTVKSTAMGIKAMNTLLLGVNSTKTYDSKAKQYKIEYYKDGLKHNIWLEDSSTVAWRSDFVSKYNLRGIGIWSLTQTPTEDIWNVINNKLKSK